MDDLKDELSKYNYKDQDYFRNFALNHFDVRKNIQIYLEYTEWLKVNKKKSRFNYKVMNLIKLKNLFKFLKKNNTLKNI